MKEKELGERNYGNFDSLKSRLNRDMKEKGITARRWLSGTSTAAQRHGVGCRSGTVEVRGGGEGPVLGNNSFLLHVAVQSVG